MFTLIQWLRGCQALGALMGMWLSGTNLRDALRDRRWLIDNKFNGLGIITAESLVFHEAGRVVVQVVMASIGLWGVWGDRPGVDDHFNYWEPFLDTVVVAVTFALSLHSRHTRTVIQRYHRLTKKEEPNARV